MEKTLSVTSGGCEVDLGVEGWGQLQVKIINTGPVELSETSGVYTFRTS